MCILCICIRIWSIFVYFHHFQASPAAHCTPLLTSRHLPAKLSADRWELAAPFINETQSAWSHSPAPQFWQGPLNFGKVAVPKKTANLLFTKKEKKLCQIWPQQTLKHFTAALMGFPPCTQSQKRDRLQQCTIWNVSRIYGLALTFPKMVWTSQIGLKMTDIWSIENF